MISVYLKELADALAFDPALASRVVAEAREHLSDVADEDHIADRDEAERRAVARFGDPHELAAQFAAISLARQARRVGLVIVLAILIVLTMMKARVAWYALVAWAMPEDARAVAGIVFEVNRYAFWMAVVIGIGALLDIALRSTPERVSAGYRRQLRRAALLASAATAALAVSVTGDLILTALRVGTEFSTASAIPIASLSVEIALVAGVIFMIAATARRMARASGAFGG
jgi:HAAS domain-containing protein